MILRLAKILTMIYEVPKVAWNFNDEKKQKQISQKCYQAFPVAYNRPIRLSKFSSPLALVSVLMLPKSFGLSCFVDIFQEKAHQFP